MHRLQQRGRHATALLRSGQCAGSQALPLRLQRPQGQCRKAVRCSLSRVCMQGLRLTGTRDVDLRACMIYSQHPKLRGEGIGTFISSAP